jgi:tetratricopeptide (TPR) repeat protein
MLVTLSTLIIATMPVQLPGVVPSGAAGVVSPAAHALPGRDSARALHVARDAQSDFENERRQLLPLDPLDNEGGCDDTVGQYCYRQQITAPPLEPFEIVVARTRLITTLDSLAALLPGDRWIAGQRVRYFIEAGRPIAADSAAIACVARATVPATSSWCLALVGYTAQQLGDYARADAAFTAALESMTPAERCEWQDVGLLLGRSAAAPYRRVECAARDSLASGFWLLVQPLYLRSVNDLRTEFLARITRMYIEQGTETPMGAAWRSDDRQAIIRYGVPLWYTRGARPRDGSRPPIAGFRREPSFNFFPDAHVFAAPDQLTAEDWDLANLVDAPSYAPLWAVSFQPITHHQVALFRRGDSAYIVAAFDAEDGVRSEVRQVGAFAAVIDRAGVLAPIGTSREQAGVGVVATLVAPWRPLIVSLEILNSERGEAQRVRFAPRLPAAGPRVSLSDLLLYTVGDSAPSSLPEVIPRALHAMRVPINRKLGVFWETYGLHGPDESVGYSLLVTRVDRGVFHRGLVRLHVADPDRPLSMEWHEAPSIANGIASRGITVDLSSLEPGRYSVKLTLTCGNELPIVVERMIEVV